MRYREAKRLWFFVLSDCTTNTYTPGKTNQNGWRSLREVCNLPDVPARSAKLAGVKNQRI